MTIKDTDLERISQHIGDKLKIDRGEAESRAIILRQLTEANGKNDLNLNQKTRGKVLRPLLRFMQVERDTRKKKIYGIKSVVLKFDGNINLKRHAGFDVERNQTDDERDLVMSYLQIRGFVQDPVLFKALEKEHRRRMKIAEKMQDYINKGITDIKADEFKQMKIDLKEMIMPFRMPEMCAEIGITDISEEDVA